MDDDDNVLLAVVAVTMAILPLGTYFFAALSITKPAT